MIFETENLYHIYNQGNNRQTIFFSRENYLFFLKKIRTHILPFADVLAWCLMPNHFHLMVCVHALEVSTDGSFTDGFTLSEAVSGSSNSKKTFNDSIGVLLRSYTRAINKQESRSGSLFRTPTRIQCLTCCDGLTPTFFNTAFGTQINVHIPEKDYPQVCFNYIHLNPVNAHLVKDMNDWEFSSAQDYFDLRDGKLINKSITSKYGIKF